MPALSKVSAHTDRRKGLPALHHVPLLPPEEGLRYNPLPHTVLEPLFPSPHSPGYFLFHSVPHQSGGPFLNFRLYPRPQKHLLRVQMTFAVRLLPVKIHLLSGEVPEHAHLPQLPFMVFTSIAFSFENSGFFPSVKIVT